jgi:hypothetical protein
VICQLRREHPRWGARRIVYELGLLGGLTSRHARRTPGLTSVLQAVALAQGGRAGARLSGRLAAGVSRMTLIRLIRALPDPAVGQAPRVLGVDLSRSWDYPDC